MSEFWDNVAKMFEEIGREENSIANIVNMLKKGLGISLISDITNKSEDYILSIKNANNL